MQQIWPKSWSQSWSWLWLKETLKRLVEMSILGAAFQMVWEVPKDWALKGHYRQNTWWKCIVETIYRCLEWNWDGSRDLGLGGGSPNRACSLGGRGGSQRPIITAEKTLIATHTSTQWTTNFSENTVKLSNEVLKCSMPYSVEAG